MRDNAANTLHVLVKPGEAPPVPEMAGLGLYTRGGQTANFNVYYDNSLGAAGQMLADAVLARCEQDFAQLLTWFGVTPGGLPFNVYIDPGTFGAFHANCAATELHLAAYSGTDGALENMLNVAEADEVMMAAQNKGWNCGASAGEGLSRVLATERYPASLDGFASAAKWLDSNRPNWVTTTEQTDRDYVSIGCATLFLNYLHYQLGFSLNAIIGAGVPTLAQVYTNLTGRTDAFDRFSRLLERRFPSGTPSGLTNDNPFPIGVLGLIVYGADSGGNLATIFGSGDMGQGPGALAWLTGNFTGSGKTEIAQPWDNNGRLGLIVYGADSGGNLATIFGSGDMGQGPGALAWLTGNFTGSGKTEIAQPWDNNGRLGLIVYGADSGGNLATIFGSGDMGQGPGALAWLTGDFTGSGKTEIAQPWDNNGRLGLIVYGADSGGNLATIFGSGDMGQGPGALAWLTGDFTGSGKTEIAQPWDNNGRLGLIVYGADSGGNLATIFGSGDMGQGPGALAWLTGDFTGSGKTEIAQPWDNNGRLGLIVYGADSGGNLATIFGSGDMGQGPGALAWLTGNFTGSGKTEIAQPWDNNGRLGLIVYGADSGGNLATIFGSGDMGQGPGALAWLTGDFTGSGKTEIAQPWRSPG